MIYISIIFNLYIDHFRFVYKSFSINIQIVSNLYINHKQKKFG
ncbi:hypothetical protein HMPREF1989_01125 [Porphyromonas gingivalis F0566]|nr:hypothetical protein HMPREF1989_01125 [Porphyromonas gingivalis F0566]